MKLSKEADSILRVLRAQDELKIDNNIKTIDIQKAETFLPVFSGFYGTIFEASEYSEIEYINDERAERGLEPIIDGDVDFNYKEYENDVCIQCTDFIDSALTELKLVTSVKMQSISSPKEYNFRNDSINVEVELTSENCFNIEKYISEHRKEFKEYLKNNYTSRSGFWSSYSNDIDVWIDDTQGFADFSGSGHYLGSILQFICDCENIDNEGMYHSLEVNLSAMDFELECSKVKCTVCGEFYVPEVSLLKEYNDLKDFQVANIRQNFTCDCEHIRFISFDLWASRQPEFKHCEG